MLHDPPTVHIGLLLLELRIPDAQSLKGKRKAVLSLKDRVRDKFNVSVAEVGELDKWQHAVIAVTSAANDHKLVDKILQSVRDYVGNDFRVHLVSAHVDFI